MTRDLKRKIRTKARRYKKANRTGKTEDWKKFKDLGNALKKNLYWLMTSTLGKSLTYLYSGKNLNVSGHISKAKEKIKLECHS